MSEWSNFNNVDDIFRSSTEGLPDNHVITVRERRLEVDIPELIQNNIKTDTITLDLDAEWEGITPVIILGSADDAVEVYYNGDPVTIPSQVAKDVGWVDCSVTGYDASGTVRLVTVAAPDTFQVIESGLYTGEVPEDEGTSLLGQLLDAAKDAQAAADSAEDKIGTIDTKLTELTTVAGNAQTAAQNAKTAAETAQKAAQDAESSVADAIFTDATAEKPGEKFLTDADGNVLQDVYLTTANGVGDKEQYVNIGRSGEINGVVVHGGRAHAQLWTRASADGQHDAYLNMYDTLDDGTQRAVLQAGYQNENTHIMLWDRDNPDARSGSFQPNRLVMADVENDAQVDFKPTVGYFDSSGSQAIVMVNDPGENGINAVMGFGNSGTGKVLSRIGVTDGTSVLELNDHTVNDISLDSFADAENPSNKNLVTEKAVAGYVDAATESLPNTLTLSTEGQFEQARPNAIVQNGELVDKISISDNADTLYGDPPYNYIDIGLNTISPTQLPGSHSGVEIKDGRVVTRLLADDTSSLATVDLAGVDTEGKEYVGARLQSLGGTGQFFLNDNGSNNRAVLRPDEITLEQKSSDGSTTSVAYISATNPDDAENKAAANLVLGDRTDYANQIALEVYNGTPTLYIGEKGANSITDDASDGDANALATAKAVKDAIDAIPDALPEGGTEGQVLTKTADGEAWKDIPEALPEGGTTGQVLTKTADGEAWQDAPEADTTNVAKIVGNQLVSYDGSSIDYVNVRGESSDSYGRVSGMGGIGFVSAGTGNDFIRLKSDSSGQCIGIRKDGIDTEYTISDTISEPENTLVTGKAVADYVETQTKRNVLVSTATGKVAHAEDAFAEKPREVRIKGKTWKNLWPVINGVSNGITLSTDETGLTTVTGTATNDAYIVSGAIDGANPNSKYTLTTSGLPSGMYVYAESRGADSSALSSIATSTTVTGTTDAEMVTLVAAVVIPNGSTVNASFRVMLVEGSEAPDCFTPTGVHGVEPEKLMVAGKNLNNVAQQIDGVAWSTSNDVGWAETAASFLDLFNSLPYGDYTLRLKCRIDSVAPESMGDPSAQNTAGFIVRSSSNINNPITMYKPVGVTNVGQTIEIVQSVEISAKNSAGYCDQIYVYSPGADSGYRCISTFFDIQLELGSTATAYEPPTVTEVTLPEIDALMAVGDYADELVIEEDGSTFVERHVERADISEATLVNGSFYPASGGNKPYFSCSLGLKSYASYEASVEDGLKSSSSSSSYSSSRYAFAGRWYNLPAGITRGHYRTWNSIIFWDEEFTDAEQAKQLILSGGGSVWAQVPESVKLLGIYQIPQLPAPTFNAYPTGGYVPGETSVTYENDVNITISNMQKTIDALLGGN